MLAELEPAQVAPEPEEPAKPVTPPPSVLDLTEENIAPTPPPGPAPSFRTIDGDSDVVFAERSPDAPVPIARAVEESPKTYAQVPGSDPGLISNNTAAAVDSAFNTLAATVLGQNARTLEDLVKEMLRPLLKSWLDDNLPGLVERIVRTEIERVSRGKP
jgi:hypothetical protein